MTDMFWGTVKPWDTVVFCWGFAVKSVTRLNCTRLVKGSKSSKVTCPVCKFPLLLLTVVFSIVLSPFRKYRGRFGITISCLEVVISFSIKP